MRAPATAAGDLDWLDVWDGAGYPHTRRAVWPQRRGWDRPTLNGTAKWSEFAQLGKADDAGERKPLPIWAQMPSHMLGKVAESLALRRAFPEISAVVAGLAGEEDVGAVAEASTQELPTP